MSNKTSIQRMSLSSGNYSTISNKALKDIRLSGDALRLLIILLNNSTQWELNIGYYSNLFGWNKNKQAKILKCLIETDYLIRTKQSLGYKKGFDYIYKIKESIKDNKSDDIAINKEKPIPEINKNIEPIMHYHEPEVHDNDPITIANEEPILEVKIISDIEMEETSIDINSIEDNVPQFKVKEDQLDKVERGMIETARILKEQNKYLPEIYLGFIKANIASGIIVTPKDLKREIERYKPKLLANVENY